MCIRDRDCALPAYRLFITGLKGGHSGSCIILELGNSLKICGRILKEISGSSDLRIVSLDGGLKNNAIPRECEAVFASGAPREQIERAMESITAEDVYKRQPFPCPSEGWERPGGPSGPRNI